MGHNRRRSRSSSSSSSSSSSDEEKKWKKKNKHGVAHGQPEHSSHGMPSPPPPYDPASHPSMSGHAGPGVAMPSFPMPGGHDMAHTTAIPLPVGHDARGISPVPGASPHAAPGGQAPPPSGFRVPLTDSTPFPAQQAGQPVAYDADGRTAVYIGSALFEKSVHPCKIVPAFSPPPRVGYGGREVEHRGRYDLLPFDPTTMEWVPTSHGQIPYGRRPVEGGYEENGQKLYHALATVNGVKVPGKAGTHIHGGANVPFGGREHAVENYEILCWRF
ncbi:hypothetical protein GY45DRAFT_1321683 [Cubamyces sp. BRFM 1775]|nr:hypothetical protein GY45DRAFT_1321683 [Cubamyces sp. BRFM 1775]